MNDQTHYSAGLTGLAEQCPPTGVHNLFQSDISAETISYLVENSQQVFGCTTEKITDTNFKLLVTDAGYRSAVVESITIDAQRKHLANRSKRKVYVMQQLSPTEKNHLNRTFHMFNLDYDRATDQGAHAFARAHRLLTQEFFFYDLGINNASRPINGYDVVVKDIGGNPTSHLNHSRCNVHTCFPVLSLNDDNRHSRYHQALRLKKQQNLKPHERECLRLHTAHDPKVICERAGEFCSVSAQSMMWNHSVYDCSVDQLARQMFVARALVGIGAFIFTPEIFYQRSGKIEILDCYFKKISKNGKLFIRFWFENDVQEAYEHEFATYLSFLTSRRIRIRDSVGRSHFYNFQLTHLNDGVLFFKMYKSTSARIPNSSPFNVFTIPELSDHIILYTWEYSTVCDKLTRFAELKGQNDHMRSVRVAIPSKLFDAGYSYAQILPDGKLTVKNILTALTSFNTREIICGTSVSPGPRIPPRSLRYLAEALFYMVYTTNYESSKMMQLMIAQEDEIRKRENLGFFSRTVRNYFRKPIKHKTPQDMADHTISSLTANAEENSKESQKTFKRALEKFFENSRQSSRVYEISVSDLMCKFITIEEEMETIIKAPELHNRGHETLELSELLDNSQIIKVIADDFSPVEEKVEEYSISDFVSCSCNLELETISNPSNGACVFQALLHHNLVEGSIIDVKNRLVSSVYLPSFLSNANIVNSLREADNTIRSNQPTKEIFLLIALEFKIRVCLHENHSCSAFGSSLFKTYHFMIRDGHCNALVAIRRLNEVEHESLVPTDTPNEYTLDYNLHQKLDRISAYFSELKVKAVSKTKYEACLKHARISTNELAFLKDGNYVCRSGLKTAEILNRFFQDLDIEEALSIGGPGAEVQVLIQKKNTKTVFGITKFNHIDYSPTIYDMREFRILIGSDDSGDILNIANRVDMYNEILTDYPEGLQFVGCDAAPDAREDEFDYVEFDNLISAQFEIMTTTLAIGGGGYIKVPNLITLPILRILSTAIHWFDDVIPVKLETSRSASSELHIVFLGFKGYTDPRILPVDTDLIPQIERIQNTFDKKQFHALHAYVRHANAYLNHDRNLFHYRIPEEREEVYSTILNGIPCSTIGSGEVSRSYYRKPYVEVTMGDIIARRLHYFIKAGNLVQDCGTSSSSDDNHSEDSFSTACDFALEELPFDGIEIKQPAEVCIESKFDVNRISVPERSKVPKCLTKILVPNNPLKSLLVRKEKKQDKIPLRPANIVDLGNGLRIKNHNTPRYDPKNPKDPAWFNDAPTSTGITIDEPRKPIFSCALEKKIKPQVELQRIESSDKVGTVNTLNSKCKSAMLEFLEYCIEAHTCYESNLRTFTNSVLLSPMYSKQMFDTNKDGYGLYHTRERRWINYPTSVPQGVDKQPGERLVIEDYCKYYSVTDKVIRTLDERALMQENGLILVSEYLARCFEKDMYDNLSKLDLNYDFSATDMYLVQAVFGSGKTTRIIRDHTPPHKNDPSTVLLATCEGKVDFLNRSTALHKISKNCSNVKKFYRTLASYLINPHKAVPTESLFIDESLMSHPGALLFAVLISKAKKIRLFGDNLQIPFVNKLPAKKLQYGVLSSIIPIGETMFTSYRSPVDVVYRVNDKYLELQEPGKKQNLMAINPNTNSCKIVEISNVQQVPIIAGAKYLVFTHADRDELSKVISNVSTVHQFQGKEADHVVVVRLNPYPQTDIFNNFNYANVALSRHRISLIYATKVTKDALSQLIKVNGKSVTCINPDENVIRRHLQTIGSIEKTFGVYTPQTITDYETFSHRSTKLSKYQGCRLHFSSTIDAPFQIIPRDFGIDITLKSSDNPGSTPQLSYIRRNLIQSRLKFPSDVIAISSYILKFIQPTMLTMLLYKNGIKKVILCSESYLPDIEPEIFELLNKNSILEIPNDSYYQNTVEIPDPIPVPVQLPFVDYHLYQYVLSTVFKGREMISQTFDSWMVHTSDLTLPSGDHSFTLVKGVYQTPGYDNLTPLIKSPMYQLRSVTSRETRLAFEKRNKSVPETMGIVDIEVTVESMLERVIDKCFDKNILNSLRAEGMRLAPDDISSWLKNQDAFVVDQIVPEYPIHRDAVNEYNYSIKRSPKPNLTYDATESYAALQTIVYHSKPINAIFCAYMRKIKSIITNSLKSHVILNCDMSPEEFEEKLNAITGPNLVAAGGDDSVIRNQYATLEVDISKYDKSQGELAVRFDVALMRYFGVPEWLCNIWFFGHFLTRIYDRNTGLKAVIPFQRKSGDASTFILNTTFLLAVLSYEIPLDDLSNIDLHNYCNSYLFSSLFNLEVKFFFFNNPYFCSKFLIRLSSGRYKLVSDPIKLLVKLGRSDIVNHTHKECYRISFSDNVAAYADYEVCQLVAISVSERYNIDWNISNVLATLPSLAIPLNFNPLFYEVPGNVIDHSRLNFSGLREFVNRA